MYWMTVLSEEDRLVATQRYLNLVRSVIEYSDYNCTTILGDVNLRWGHSVSGDDVPGRTMVPSFVLGEDEFYVDVSVYSNKAWDKWVETQPVRGVIYEKDRLLTEFMEFVFDYYPDYEV